MSGFKCKPMPSAVEPNAEQVSGTGKITRQSKSHRPLLRQRNRRGLGGYAILVHLGVPEPLRLKQHIRYRPNHRRRPHEWVQA
jgi:hypothetical protein